MSDKLKLEPEQVAFKPPFDESQMQCKATNISGNKITTKLNCSDTKCVQASPVYAVIEPGAAIGMTFQFRFADGQPSPKKTYVFGIVIADAPADLTNDAAKIKEAWNALTPARTIKLTCTFLKPGEEAPPPAAAAPAPAAEAPPAEGEAPAAEGEAPAQ